MTDDVRLLRRYSAEGCEAAFSELVERFLPLVYSAALRQVGGNRQMAEDVAQHVFAELARVAGSLSSEVVLSGWIYRATRFTAAKMVRAESRRRAREAAAAREQESESMSAPQAENLPDWDALSSHLDEAMNELEQGDRHAILLRFFQQMDFRALGAALKTSDDTAQKRVSRALDKLRLLLVQRGVALSAAALGALLANNAVAAPPPGLVAIIVRTATTGSAIVTASASGGIALKIAASSLKAKFACTAAVLVMGTVAWAVWQGQADHGAPGFMPPGLISAWTADGTTADRNGKNDGLIEGNVTYAPGVLGQAFHFDGREGTRIKVPHRPSLNLTNAGTLEFWFRPDEDSMMGSLVVKRTEDSEARLTGNLVNYGFSLGRIHADHQNGICQFFNDPEQTAGYHARLGGISLFESIFPNLNLPWNRRFAFKKNLFEQTAFFPTKSRDLSVLRGQWHHLAGTFTQVDSNHVRMISYFDGVLRNQIVLPGCLANTVNDAALSIGGFPTSPFKGCIDEIHLFDRELTAKEVKGLSHLSNATAISYALFNQRVPE